MTKVEIGSLPAMRPRQCLDLDGQRCLSSSAIRGEGAELEKALMDQLCTVLPLRIANFPAKMTTLDLLLVKVHQG